MDVTGEQLRHYRAAAGLSVADAARELRQRAPAELPGQASLVRSWKRWEAGTRPSRTYQSLLATQVSAPLTGPTGLATVDLSGDWWAGWQSWRDRAEVSAVQPVRLRQNGDLIRWQAVQRGRPVADGGYLWVGELRLWDGGALTGHYVADDGAVRSLGSVYFVVHPGGQHMTGRWTGRSWDGDTVTGLGAMARTKVAATTLIRDLIQGETGGADR